MKFRTIVLLALVLLVGAILAATVGVVVTLLDRSARAGIADDLARTRAVFEDLHAYRETLYATEIRVVADEPRIKAVVAAEDTTPETILGVARDMHRVLQSDLLWLTDEHGRVLADVTRPRSAGTDRRGVPVVAAALQRRTASDVWVEDGAVHHLQAHQVAFGDTVYGLIVVGHRIDDRVVRTVHQQTASAAVIDLGGRVLAASTFEGEALPREEIERAIAAVPADAASPVEVSIAGTRYLAVSGPFPGYRGAAPMRYVLLRSLDRVLAPARRLTRILYGMLAASLLVAFALSWVLSSRLSRPIDRLVAVTRDLGAGKLEARAEPRGPAETRALAEALNRMAAELEQSRRDLAARERVEKEMEIAMRIQTALLPTDIRAEGLDIAARMIPAADVGGDYYDIHPVADGCWIGIGDVAGHGVTAGLVMLMVQSVVASLVEEQPDRPPSDHLCTLNRLLYRSIRDRLRRDEHVTLTLLRYHRDGRVQYAGAHEDLILVRATGGPAERLRTTGTWVGGQRDIRRFTTDSELRLRDGDLLVLYTDGITEAGEPGGEQFGLERLCAQIEAARAEPVEVIRDRVLAAATGFAAALDDDVSLVVLRYRSVA